MIIQMRVVSNNIYLLSMKMENELLRRQPLRKVDGLNCFSYVVRIAYRQSPDTAASRTK